MLHQTQSHQNHIGGLVQDCSNSSALAMELLQSCTKPSIWNISHWCLFQWCGGAKSGATSTVELRQYKLESTNDALVRTPGDIP